MLHASKQALERALQAQAVDVQFLELDFYYKNYDAVSTISAMLAGFSFDILKQMSEPDKVWRIKQNEQMWLWYLFSGLTVMGLSLLLMTTLAATLCQIWGPGKALRGKEGSFGVATNAMRSERGFALRCFAGGMLCFVGAVACYAILANIPTEIYAIVVVLVFTTFLAVVSALRIHRRFRIPEEEKKTGHFNVRESLYDADPEANLGLLRQRQGYISDEG